MHTSRRKILTRLSRSEVSAEEALRKSTRRFSERFRRLEMALRRKGKTLEESTPEEMGDIWKRAKNLGKKKGRKRH
jgi:uncharacterized protein YabN with tetrapyrrole methylase and pyrophosphatase domain